MKKFDAIKEALEIFYPHTSSVLHKYAVSCKKQHLTLDYFISTISKDTYNLKELGISTVSISKLLKELLPDRDGTINAKPCTHILDVAGMKFCGKCSQVLPIEDFRKNSSRKQGINTYCKTCHLETTSITQAGRQSQYKASKILRTMPWSDYGAIKDFYNNCPEGYHVDHVIPLNGELVSGLHVLDNLQYLLAAENCSKNNKFTV